MPVPFKIHADFECIFKKVESKSNSSYTRKYQDHIPCSFPYKVVCIDNEFSKKVVFTEERMLFTNLLNQFLMSTIIAEK